MKQCIKGFWKKCPRALRSQWCPVMETDDADPTVGQATTAFFTAEATLSYDTHGGRIWSCLPDGWVHGNRSHSLGPGGTSFGYATPNLFTLNDPYGVGESLNTKQSLRTR